MEPNNRYDSLFRYYSEIYGLDWLRLKAQGMAESNLDPCAVSPVGARGMMQFMPATFEECAAKLRLTNPDAYNPEHSIACAAFYMRGLMRRYNSDWERALAAYNWGMGNVDRLVTMDWKERLPHETRSYIARCHSCFNSLV